MSSYDEATVQEVAESSGRSATSSSQRSSRAPKKPLKPLAALARQRYPTLTMNSVAVRQFATRRREYLEQRAFVETCPDHLVDVEEPLSPSGTPAPNDKAESVASGDSSRTQVARAREVIPTHEIRRPNTVPSSQEALGMVENQKRWVEEHAGYLSLKEPMVTSPRPPTIPRPPRCGNLDANRSPQRVIGGEEAEEGAELERSLSPTSKRAARTAEIAALNAEREALFAEECKYLRARFMFDRSKKVHERRIYAKRITTQWENRTKGNPLRVNAVADAERVHRKSIAHDADIKKALKLSRMNDKKAEEERAAAAAKQKEEERRGGKEKTFLRARAQRQSFAFATQAKRSSPPGSPRVPAPPPDLVSRQEQSTRMVPLERKQRRIVPKQCESLKKLIEAHYSPPKRQRNRQNTRATADGVEEGDQDDEEDDTNRIADDANGNDADTTVVEPAAEDNAPPAAEHHEEEEDGAGRNAEEPEEQDKEAAPSSGEPEVAKEEDSVAVDAETKPNEATPAEEKTQAEATSAPEETPPEAEPKEPNPTARVQIVRCAGLSDEDPFGSNDPFVVMKDADSGAELFRTKVKEGAGSACEFDNAFVDLEQSQAQRLRVEVWDKDISSDDLIGVATVPVPQGLDRPDNARLQLFKEEEPVKSGMVILRWFPKEV